MSLNWIRQKHVKVLVLVLFMMFFVVNVNLYSTLYDYWRTKSAAVSPEAGSTEIDLIDGSLFASGLDEGIKQHKTVAAPEAPSNPTQQSLGMPPAGPVAQKIVKSIQPDAPTASPTPGGAVGGMEGGFNPFRPLDGIVPGAAADNETNSTLSILSLDPSICGFHGVPSSVAGVCGCFVDYDGPQCNAETERPTFLNSGVLSNTDNNILPVGDTYLFGVAPVKLGPDIVSLFPPASSQKLIYNSCALVSNSEELLQVEWGAEIDSHDMVMRFNNAPINRYEKHVGVKTTYDFFNIYALSGVRTGKAPWNSADRNASIILHLRAPHWIAEYARFRRAQPDIKVEVLDSRLSKAMYNLWYAFVPDTKKFPTTGFFGILYSLRMCRHVHLYGFFKHTLQGVKYSKYSYHNNKQPDMWSHDQKVEKEIIAFITLMHNTTLVGESAQPFIINESITYHNTNYQPKYFKAPQRIATQKPAPKPLLKHKKK